MNTNSLLLLKSPPLLEPNLPHPSPPKPPLTLLFPQPQLLNLESYLNTDLTCICNAIAGEPSSESRRPSGLPMKLRSAFAWRCNLMLRSPFSKRNRRKRCLSIPAIQILLRRACFPPQISLSVIPLALLNFEFQTTWKGLWLMSQFLNFLTFAKNIIDF